MSRPIARALFLFSSITLSLLFVILMVGGLGRMVVVAEGTGRSPSRLPNSMDAIELTAGPSPTLCLTTTQFLVPSSQDLGLDGFFLGSRHEVELADFNGDGLIDILQSGLIGGMSTIWLNDGTAHFTYREQMLFTGNSAAVAVGDLDGDDDIDLLSTGDTIFSSPQSQIFFNNGDGYFFAGSPPSIPSDDAIDLQLADIDGDNDLDAVVAYSSTAPLDRVFWNDGTGSFTAAITPIGSTYARQIILADLNNDQAPDLLVARSIEPTQIWFNNGSGSFILQPQTLSDSYAIALGDVNDDTFPDVVTDGLQTWLNDGAGHFTLLSTTDAQPGAHPYGLNDFGLALELADINGDDSPDVLYSFYNLDGMLGPFGFFFNDGHGSFCEAGFQDIRRPTDIAVADLDGDGDKDVVLAQHMTGFDPAGPPDPFGPLQRIWLNNGPVEPIQIDQIVNSGPILPARAIYIQTLLSSGTNLTVDWNMGNGIHDTRLNPLIENGYFAATGTYTLVLTLTNELGSVTTHTTILVADQITPSLDLSHPQYAPPLVPVPFVLERFAIDIADIRFGDEDFGFVNRADDTLFHIYTQPGVYTVTSHGSVGNISTTSRITITENTLWDLQILTEQPIHVGTPTTFTATLAYGQPTSFTWDMGDGTMAHGAVVTHTYASPGPYTVTLTVADQFTSLHATVQIQVLAPSLYLPILVAAPP